MRAGSGKTPFLKPLMPGSLFPVPAGVRYSAIFFIVPDSLLIAFVILKRRNSRTTDPIKYLSLMSGDTIPPLDLFSCGRRRRSMVPPYYLLSKSATVYPPKSGFSPASLFCCHLLLVVVKRTALHDTGREMSSAF